MGSRVTLKTGNRTMKFIVKVGKWQFELKQVFARKAANFGDEYQASAVITIADGTPHVELLINKHDDKFSKQDYDDFKAFLTQLGFENAKYSRFKSSTKKEVEKKHEHINS